MMPRIQYGARSLASLNFTRVSNKVTSSYIMDPYAMLMHYKRVFKLLGSMRRLPGGQRARVLVLGNKHQFGIDWKNRFQGFDFLQGSMDDRVISSAVLHYELILCLDPVLYARHLQRINLPIVMAATTKEIHDYPEILDVTDYLLPVPGTRHDVALRQLIAEQILIDDPKESQSAKAKDQSRAPKAKAAEGSAKTSGDSQDSTATTTASGVEHSDTDQQAPSTGTESSAADSAAAVDRMITGTDSAAEPSQAGQESTSGDTEDVSESLEASEDIRSTDTEDGSKDSQAPTNASSSDSKPDEGVSLKSDSAADKAANLSDKSDNVSKEQEPL